MNAVTVERISKDGLTKFRFGFEFSLAFATGKAAGALCYVEHYTFHRDSKQEKWGDKWPKPLSYAEWCEKHGHEVNYCSCDDIDEECPCNHEILHQYYEYQKKMNPTCNRTKDGKAKMLGTFCTDSKRLPSCPKDVAREALKKFVKKASQTKVVV